LKSLAVTGLALWTPGYGSIGAWARGEHDASVVDCSCAWVPARLLRGASRFTRMLGEAADQATRDAGGDPKTIATVYGSDYGEIETMVVLLDTIFRGDGQLSPMRFKNSVHNAASGLASIGQGNQSFSTALAAGTRTFEASMLEAMALLDERGGAVVVSIADDVLPEPLLALEGWEALAVGIVLQSEADPSKVIATLGDVGVEEPSITPRATHFRGRALGDRLRSTTAAAALPLFDALADRKAGRVSLAPGAEGALAVSVVPGARQAI
jgi:hypothetical protein